MIIKTSGRKMEMNSSLKLCTFKDSGENFPCSLTIHYSHRVNFDKLLKMYLRKKKDKMNFLAPCFNNKKLFSQFPIEHLYNNKHSENKVAFLQLKLKIEKEMKKMNKPNNCEFLN